MGKQSNFYNDIKSYSKTPRTPQFKNFVHSSNKTIKNVLPNISFSCRNGPNLKGRIIIFISWFRLQLRLIRG